MTNSGELTSSLLPKYQPHLRVADPVNTDEALVTEHRRDDLTNCCGENAIDSLGFHRSGSLMPRRWQPDAKKVAAPPSG